MWDFGDIAVNEKGELKFRLASKAFTSMRLDSAVKAARGLRKAFPDREVTVVGYAEDDHPMIYDDAGNPTVEYHPPERDYVRSEYWPNEDGLIHYFDADNKEIRTEPFIELVQE